ncbi:MAG: winged helix-turn-helix domain-containing protein [Saprospiraceae bacterium]|nr:winged helix-turn-helix domain-containing protein [Saprospiraceae bacterium]MBX2889809.1 winged helix-turn-helix domain-containing protein [Saprospiraceae bacterium]MBX2889984.1 winged helix-turn-helix domain-containing protein [Saprospiraceae bacterium]MBX2890211.1 winged helix-turn-helix domain-containing protein [Saprospiraceae bacterium]MBX2890375.1 winged helix-turn-helix domain-containing protein [Saprospiraceae bacterium]
MKKRLSSVSYEGMRLRAVEMFRSGKNRQDIMSSLGIPKSTLSRWLARYDADNPAWYKSLPPGGTQSKLGTEDLRRLVEELNKGCTAQGFEGEIWTRGRVGVVIERLFGVKYDPSHVGRLLKKVGWSLQRPSKQARQRSEERVQKWYAEDIGRIKKK